ncbi:aminotransferase class III-fold pyridoxal phosphate-dependent enzyme, partial [Clostridium perfringens]
PNIIEDVRGLGLSIGVDLPNKLATKKICYQCIKNGLLLISLGENTLRIQPPLIITKTQLDKSIEILENSINYFIKGKISDDAYIFINGW